MCLHCGLNLSEVLPSWLKDLAWNFDHLLPLANSVLRTPGGLARSKETSAFNIRNLGEGIGGPRNDTILAGILFQDGKIYGVPLNSWLLCLLCFPCDGSRRFIVTAAPNSQRITDNSDQTFELLTLWHFNYPIWSLDSVWRCLLLFSPYMLVKCGWRGFIMDSQTWVKLIETCAPLAQALWKSLTSRARWRALRKAADKIDCKAFPHSLS